MGEVSEHLPIEDDCMVKAQTEISARYSHEAVIYVGNDLFSHPLSRAVQSETREK